MHTVILEFIEDFDRLVLKIEGFLDGLRRDGLDLRVACQPGQKETLSRKLAPRFPGVQVEETETLQKNGLKEAAGLTAFLPESTPYTHPRFNENLMGSAKILPWIPTVMLPETGCVEPEIPSLGWMADFRHLKAALDPRKSMTLHELETSSKTAGVPNQYLSSPRTALAANPPDGARESGPAIHQNSSVLAVVPHFNCEEWLDQCLRSLVSQSRPLDGIVVVDDGSASLPLKTIQRYENVTLLKTKENSGPYRIIQSIIESTNYDAYLFQDADDWSSTDRLELLLAEAERTGAELVGSQEILAWDDRISLKCYPLDVNRALSMSEGFALLHPTSLVSRDLVLRTGGYSPGLRFSGDYEFLLRAGYMGRIVNVRNFCYFHRIRKNSLTMAKDTGYGSRARLELNQRIQERARSNKVLVSRGQAPALEPIQPGSRVAFDHLAGPPLAERKG